VADRTVANSSIEVLVHRVEAGAEYDLNRLSRKKRNKVRKGFRELEVEQFEVTAAVVDEMLAVVVSHAERTRAGLPVEYYAKHADEWKSGILQQGRLPNREWWSARHNGRLIAYFYTYEVDGVVIINAAKNHTDYQQYCPNDALVFHTMQYYINQRRCRSIFYGDAVPARAGLTKFKEQHNFSRFEMPIIRRVSPFMAAVEKVMHSRSR